MNRFKKGTVFILTVFLILGLLGYMYISLYRTKPFDIREFDQEHHTTFENSGYFYSQQTTLVPPGYLTKVYIFHGVREGLGYSNIRVYNTRVDVDATDLPDAVLLEESEHTVLSLPATILLYKESDSTKEIYRPSFKAFFDREGYFYVLWINYDDIYTKDTDYIDEKDVVYIEKYLTDIFSQ